MTKAPWLVAVLVLARVALPAAADPPAADRAIERAIDDLIDSSCQTAGVQPAPVVDDAAFVRRVTLDLVGRIPTLAETNEYTSSTDPDKKTKLIERLLQSPAFARHQAQEFTTLFRLEERSKQDNTKPLRDYLRASFAEDRPWDQIFRDVLLPDESPTKGPGVSTFLKTRAKDLNRLTIDVSRLFFGVNIDCAQCHDHPHVPGWTQDHFYGMKSFFARTFEKDGIVAEHEAGVVKYIPNKAKEKVAPVMFLTGKVIDAPNLREPNDEEKKQTQQRVDQAKKGKTSPAPPSFSLRAKLVETALEPDQREFFTRSIVNRLLYRFLGRGLVMPLDQMHPENAPSHPELLDWLARDLVEHNYDLRRQVRGIVLSQAYARSSRWDGDKTPDDKLFAMGRVRALTPMQLAVSLKVAALDQDTLPKDGPELEQRLDALEKSAEKLSGLFADPGDNFQVSASEALLLANNEELLRELLEGPATLPTRLQQLTELSERAEFAVRSVLGRTARADEVQTLTDYLRQRTDRPLEGCQQVVWALLNSAEFRFNH